MNDPHFALVSKVSLIQKLLQLPQSFTTAHTDDVEFVMLDSFDTDGNRRHPFRRSFRPRASKPFRGYLDSQAAPPDYRPAWFERQQFAANVAKLHPVANF
jgi:hypothetical protein